MHQGQSQLSTATQPATKSFVHPSVKMQVDFLKPASWKATWAIECEAQTATTWSQKSGREKQEEQTTKPERGVSTNHPAGSLQPWTKRRRTDKGSCSTGLASADDDGSEDDIVPPPTKKHRSLNKRDNGNSQTLQTNKQSGGSVHDNAATEQLGNDKESKGLQVATEEEDKEKEETKEMIDDLKGRLDHSNHEISSMKSQLRPARSNITDSLKVMSEKEEELRRTKEQLGKLQEELHKSVQRLQTTTANLTKKDQTLHNKTQEVRYQRERVATLEKKLLEKGELQGIPSTCGTKMQAQEIVCTIRKILENVTKNMKTNSKKSNYFFEHLSSMFLDSTVHGGQLKRCAYKVFRKYIQIHMCLAERVL
ncbi:hypothetical protein ACA910_007048 [Epithemia clementina (nom. ined.)]